MPTTEKWIISSVMNLIPGKSLNAFANNTPVLGPTFGDKLEGENATFCRLILTYKFQSLPLSKAKFSFWFIPSTEENPLVIPSRKADVSFHVTADLKAHSIARDLFCPRGLWKPLLFNNETGQNLTANNSDNILGIAIYTRQPTVVRWPA